MRRRELIVSLAGAALLTHGIMPKRSAMAAWLGFTWTKVPAIIVVGAAEDRRLALTRDAVAFWNDTLARLGSGFRLGAITQGPERVPDAVIAGMSRSVLSGRKVSFLPSWRRSPVTSSWRCQTLTSSRSRRTGQTARASLRSRAGPLIR
jgi:hypothetical protein